jgi:hypothetical protein
MTTFRERLGAWREVSSHIEHTAPRYRERHTDADYLRNKQARLAELNLTSVQIQAQFIADLKRLVTKDCRQDDPELQQLLEDYGALALGHFTQQSDLALRMAMERVIADRPPAVTVRRITQPPPPRRKSLTEWVIGR